LKKKSLITLQEAGQLQNNQDVEKKNKWIDIVLFLDKYRVLLIFALLLIVASFLSDAFLTTNNLFNVFRQVSIIAIMSVGMTLVILTAGIDLSVGSVMAFSGAVLAGVSMAGVPLPVAILRCLVVGIVLGVCNGFIISEGKVPAFIATLAVMVIARGMTVVCTRGNPIVVSHSGFRFIGSGKILGIPLPIILMLAIFIIMYWVLK